MTENIQRTFELIHEDRRQTNLELADTTGFSYGVCQKVSTENLNMWHRIAAKFVPQLLAGDQSL
jgi:hypothetical protein